MNGTQIGVLKQAHKVGLTGLLQSPHSCTLEPQVSLEILGNLTNQTLEWQLADQKFGRLLVTTDFTEGDSSWPVSMGLLHTPSRRGRFSGSLGSQLLPGSFSSS